MVSPEQRRGEQRRTEILTVARGVLIEEGLDAFVLRTIAGRVGITLGNLQYYFTTRDDLLVAVIEAEFDHDLAIISATVAECGAQACTLADVADRLVRHWRDGGSVFVALWLLAYQRDRFRRLNRSIYSRFYDELAVLVRAADPRAGDVEVNTRVRLVTAVLDGVATQRHAADDGNGDAALIARASDLVMRLAAGTA